MDICYNVRRLCSFKIVFSRCYLIYNFTGTCAKGLHVERSMRPLFVKDFISNHIFSKISFLAIHHTERTQEERV